jgi:phosphoesterase RecJ-like protein
MIYDLYECGKGRGLVLTTEAARLLYAGIVGDTGRFLFDNTTEKTFQIAGKLRTYGFSITDLYKELYKTRLNIVRLNGYVLKNFELSQNGAASIKLDEGILKKYQVTADETSQLVHAFSDVEGIKAWVFFIEEPDEIRVRLRSKGPVINEIAKKYDGGGHPLAAGAKVHTWEEADRVVRDLEEVCENFPS